MANFLSKVFDDFFDNPKKKLEMNHQYNIEKISYDKYMLTLAVPGYKKNELNISFSNGILSIKGLQEKNDAYHDKDYLYKGFTSSPFENNFSLSDRLEVLEANLRNGLLHILLKDKFSNKNLISPVNHR